MSYYAPKSSEINNLYTTGKLLGVYNESTGIIDEYQGYYHIYYNGEVYSGRNSNDFENKGAEVEGNIFLYYIEGNESPFKVNLNLNGKPSIGSYIKNPPTKIQPRPTSGDYLNGFLRRFFYYSSTTSNNEVNFELGETNLRNYNKIISSDPSLKPIYKAIEINWKIKSIKEEETIRANKIQVKSKFKNILSEDKLQTFINSVGGYSKWWRRGN